MPELVHMVARTPEDTLCQQKLKLACGEALTEHVSHVTCETCMYRVMAIWQFKFREHFDPRALRSDTVKQWISDGEQFEKLYIGK